MKKTPSDLDTDMYIPNVGPAKPVITTPEPFILIPSNIEIEPELDPLDDIRSYYKKVDTLGQGILSDSSVEIMLKKFSIEEFIEFISNCNPSLTILSLNSLAFYTQEQVLMVLKKLPKSLKELQLLDTNLEVQDLIDSMQFFPPLEQLSIAHEDIGDVSLNLASNFSAALPRSLLSLDLSEIYLNCFNENKTLQEFFKNLPPNLTNLSVDELILGDNKEIIELANCFPKTITNLSVKIDFLDDVGIKLAEFIMLFPNLNALKIQIKSSTHELEKELASFFVALADYEQLNSLSLVGYSIEIEIHSLLTRTFELLPSHIQDLHIIGFQTDLNRKEAYILSYKLPRTIRQLSYADETTPITVTSKELTVMRTQGEILADIDKIRNEIDPIKMPSLAREKLLTESLPKLEELIIKGKFNDVEAFLIEEENNLDMQDDYLRKFFLTLLDLIRFIQSDIPSPSIYVKRADPQLQASSEAPQNFNSSYAPTVDYESLIIESCSSPNPYNNFQGVVDLYRFFEDGDHDSNTEITNPVRCPGSYFNSNLQPTQTGNTLGRRPISDREKWEEQNGSAKRHI